ncbi:hypothetical protein SAMN05720606_11222 [Paenibacillus polysaccharolyticus]|uniref:Uncharacterized protein n=1 Tax=Paenibacillus polysaccharolyticus TaxID=582692 RepID=A0A1G5JVQ6_9BACL|nr:hypothetical protein SAMN05720606_11222 [Paenibacillus polysaccharolyticus]
MAAAGTEQSIYTPQRAIKKRNTGVLYTYVSSLYYSNRTITSSTYIPEMAGREKYTGIRYEYNQGQYQTNKTQDLSLYTSKSAGTSGQLRLAGVQHWFRTGELHHRNSSTTSEQHIYSIWGYDQEDLPQLYKGRFMPTDTHGVIISHSHELSLYNNIGYLPLHNKPGSRYTGRISAEDYSGTLTQRGNGSWKVVTEVVLPSRRVAGGIIRSFISGQRTLASSGDIVMQYILKHTQGNDSMTLKGHFSGQPGNMSDPEVSNHIPPRRYPATYIPVRRRSLR